MKVEAVIRTPISSLKPDIGIATMPPFSFLFYKL
jgi:hypothetical protein